MRWFFLCLFLLASGAGFTQDLADGLYRTFEQFTQGRPIVPSQIISSGSRDDLNFLKQEVQRKAIRFKDSQDSIREVSPKNLWGFVSNRTLFIRHNDEFNRVLVIGSLCHFTAVLVTLQDPYDPYRMGGPVYSREVRQYILDIREGKVLDFSVNIMTHILQRDPELAAEFAALKKSKQRKSLFIYLRKYNERHPWMGQG